MSTPEPRPVWILGTRTFAQEVADIVCETPGLTVAGYVANLERPGAGATLDGKPVIWVDDLARYVQTHWAVCGLGTTRRNLFVDQVAAIGVRFATVVHPTARISARTGLGEGTIVNAGAIIAAHSVLGRHVSINRGALIGHHTHIEDFVTVGPGANVAGNCWIEPGVYIGMSAVVIDHVRIGAGSVVGAGAVVTRDVPAHVLVVGVPAGIAKENVEAK